jgi:DNA-binding MarR family transcriptional regulator
MLARILSETGLDQWVRPGMGPVLYALYARDNCTISDIADRTLLSASTLTGTLKALERSGLVRLSKDKTDRRAVRVRVTPLGRKLEPQLHELRREVQRVLRGDLDDEGVQQAKMRLAEMIHAMDVHQWESNDPRKRRRSQ